MLIGHIKEVLEPLTFYDELIAAVEHLHAGPDNSINIQRVEKAWQKIVDAMSPDVREMLSYSLSGALVVSRVMLNNRKVGVKNHPTYYKELELYLNPVLDHLRAFKAWRHV